MFFLLEKPWPPPSLTDAAGIFSNKKPFVCNLSLFLNKLLARIGSIFQALYMVLRVGLYLSSSIWGMPRDSEFARRQAVIGASSTTTDFKAPRTGPSTFLAL